MLKEKLMDSAFKIKKYFQFVLWRSWQSWERLPTRRYAVLRLETLSCDRRVGGKSDSQQRSSVSSNCNSESRPRATEPFYGLVKVVGQLNDVKAANKMHTSTNFV